MDFLIDFFLKPMPWYYSGPLIGLTVPLLILTSNKQFGVSSSLRYVCSALKLSNKSYFKYNFKEQQWTLWFVLGIMLSGIVLFQLTKIEMGELSTNANQYFNEKEIEVEGIFPKTVFNWSNLFSEYGLLLLMGGFFIGFGSRYADGCTSGHAIMGLSLLSKASLVSVIGFFIGGVAGTFLILDYIL
jgi:uncharacterized membrane protein YedE/YeeE